MVQEALQNRRWISDIQGALIVGVLVDYMQLWELLEDFQLQPEVEDKHIFSIAANGAYSAKTTMRVSSLVRLPSPTMTRCGKLGLRLNVGFSYG
jgi:hypothetical protein